MSSRSVRSAAGLTVGTGLTLGAVLLGASGCSIVSDLNPLSNRWSAEDLEQGLAAVAEEAGTDQVVEARSVGSALRVTLLTAAGEPAYVEWNSRTEEAIPFTDERGFAASEVTAANTVSLADIDPEVIVERNPCERDDFAFAYRPLGWDGSHRHLVTVCSDSGATETGETETGEVHEYVDSEPVEEIDLTDPAAVAELTETAAEYTGQPPSLSSVRLGYVRHADDLDFSYAAGTTRSVNLEGTECQLLYTRTTQQDYAASGSINTPCHDPEDSYQGSLTPFDASAFDPAIMVQLFTSEIGERTNEEEIPSVTLMREAGGELVYAVDPGEGSYEFFDLEGNPLE